MVSRRPNEEDSRPPQIEEEPLEPPLRQPSGEKRRFDFGGGGIGKSIAVSVIVTLVIVLGMGMFGGGVFVSKTDFTKNITGMVTDINIAKTDVKTAQSTLQTAIQGIPSTVSQQVTNSISTWKSQIDSATSAANTAKSTADSAKSTSDALSTKLTALESQFNAYKVATDAKIVVLEAEIADLTPNAEDVPTITSFTPTSGNTGNLVIITGTNFVDVTAVSFGGTAVQSFAVNSATQITAVVGVGATGNVSVTTSGGTGSLGTFTFTGVAVPTISSFTPLSGTTGTSVVINGTNFTGVTSVSFGGVVAQSFVVNSTTQITAVVGSGATGVASVSTSTGTATSTSIFSFTGVSQGNVIGTIVGGSTMSLVSTGTTINVSIQNNSGKAVYAEQLSLTIQFLNPPSAISTWGLLLNGMANNPSYSIVPGIVSYVWNASAYIPSGTSQTVSITVTAPNLTVYPQNFQATVSVTGYSAL